jgi:hypothetical protein
MKWKDEKNKTLISIVHDDLRFLCKQEKGQVMKPAVVINFNKEIGSVDLADNYVHCYVMARNGLKVYKVWQ